MPDIDAQIQEFEKELSTTKYNKRTQHHIGLVKAKIAALKDKKQVREKQKKAGIGYTIRKSGDATAVFLGFPSVGKSTLLNGLTNAKSEVAEYDFTTLGVIPGMLEYNNTKIQLLDVPGIVEGAASGRGKGREVLSVIRGIDLIVVVLDVTHPGHRDIILREVNEAGIRLNQKKPDVKITKTAKNGIRIGKTVPLKMLDDPTIKDILKEFRINNADVLIRDRIDVDQLIDAIEGNKAYIPGIVVLNKIDLADPQKLEELKRAIKPDIIVSAKNKLNLEQLKEMIFKRIGFVRVYMKEQSKEPDMTMPAVLFEGATLHELCRKIHTSFINRFRFARIWGKSVKFPGQKIVKLSHQLKDDDVVELHLN